MNKDKAIKDLKERNDKLLEQYRYRDIRCITLENRLDKLQKENKQLKTRIDKAIELLNWVNEMKTKYTNYNPREKDYLDTLLQILKGDNNE